MLSILKKNYKTLNLIEVDSKALRHNYHYFQNLHAESQIAPVLKSNAYGHGLTLVGKYLDSEIKPPMICVDSLYEAHELTKVSIKTPILIMGYTFPENFSTHRKLKNIIFPAYDEPTLAALNQYQPGCRVHIKIDSGMNRLGIQPQQVPSFIKILKKYPHLNVEGIYSHLSQADIPARTHYTNRQIQSFKATIKTFESAGFKFKWKHIAATAGALTITDPEFNLIRLGLGFYGLSPLSKSINPLRPALRLISHIAQIKTVEPGSEISYGGTYIAKKKMIIGILPLGYYDGIDRRLSNIGMTIIDNKPCPITGRVCMNVTIVDLSSLKKPYVGQPAIIYSNNPKDSNSISKVAEKIDTIPYTVMTGLSESTRRLLL